MLTFCVYSYVYRAVTGIESVIYLFVQDYPDRLKECQIVIEKVLSMPTPTLTTEPSVSEDDKPNSKPISSFISTGQSNVNKV